MCICSFMDEVIQAVQGQSSSRLGSRWWIGREIQTNAYNVTNSYRHFMFYCMQTKCVMLNQVLTEFAIFYIEQILTSAVCKLFIDHSNSNVIL